MAPGAKSGGKGFHKGGQQGNGGQQKATGGKGPANSPSFSLIHGKGGGAGMNFQESFAMSLGAAMAPIMAQQAGSLMGMSCQPTMGHAGGGGGQGGQAKAPAWGP